MNRGDGIILGDPLRYAPACSGDEATHLIKEIVWRMKLDGPGQELEEDLLRQIHLDFIIEEPLRCHACVDDELVSHPPEAPEGPELGRIPQARSSVEWRESPRRGPASGAISSGAARPSSPLAT